MLEEWRIIKNFEYYEVSNFGRVKSNHPRYAITGPKILALRCCQSNGYSIVGLWKNKRYGVINAGL